MFNFHISINHNQREDGWNVQIFMCLFSVQAFALTVTTEKSIHTVCYYLRCLSSVWFWLLGWGHVFMFVCFFSRWLNVWSCGMNLGVWLDAFHAFTYHNVYSNVLWSLSNCCLTTSNVFLPSHSDTPPKSNVVETSECYEGRGRGYRGTVDVTPTGLTCQRWDSQYPHNHTFTPQAYTCKWVASARAHTCAVPAGPRLTSCVFQRPERELLSQSRWPRVPLVLHHRPEDPDDALHQHPPVRHPKQSRRWASQRPRLTEKPNLHLRRGGKKKPWCVCVCVWGGAFHCVTETQCVGLRGDP